jgi:dual specificity protein phosphatase 1B
MSAVKDMASEDLAGHFEECFAFIDGARAEGGRVLVHCFMGR